jgi:hypothetical protein
LRNKLRPFSRAVLTLLFAFSSIMVAEKVTTVKEIKDPFFKTIEIRFSKAIAGKFVIEKNRLVYMGKSTISGLTAKTITDVAVSADKKNIVLNYPAGFELIYEKNSASKIVTVRGLNIASTKLTIRRLMDEKKYKLAIDGVRAVLKIDKHDGEAWYIGGLLRKRNGQPKMAQINFNNAKANGWTAANEKSKGQTQPTPQPPAKNSAKNTQPKPEESTSDQPKTKPQADVAQSGEGFSPYPFLIILGGVLILLFFLYGRRRKKFYEDYADDTPPQPAAARQTDTPVPSPQAPPVRETPKPIDIMEQLNKNDAPEALDPDATIFFDANRMNEKEMEPDPNIDFSTDYPVAKEKSEVSFDFDEELALESVIHDINKKKKTEPSDQPIKISEDSERDARRVARQRLLEIGNETCYRVLHRLDSGLTPSQIAAMEDLSEADIDMIAKYLKLQ